MTDDEKKGRDFTKGATKYLLDRFVPTWLIVAVPLGFVALIALGVLLAKLTKE